MTRIDFYVLPLSSEQERIHFAARLCEKAFKQNLKVMILTANSESAKAVDEALWHSKPESFIPHQMSDAETQHNEQVVISSGTDQTEHHGLLINLGFEVPTMFSRFERLAEIVVQNEPTLKATRTHYNFYRERGYPINSHKIANQ